MMTLRQGMLAAVLTAVTLAGGCGADKASSGGTGGANANGGAIGNGGANGNGGATGAGGAGIPLVDWVSDLTIHHTTEASPADTVDDKVIIDTADPAAFDPLLQQH